MHDSERIKFNEYKKSRISIGITSNGIRKISGFIPWETTGHAFNMRTPDIYFEESDFQNPTVLNRLLSFEVIGCYIFTPLSDYSFLSQFDKIEDLYIEHGQNLQDLSFAKNMKEWFMFYLEDSNLENLNDLFLQKDHSTGIHAYCFGLTNCRIKDIDAIAKSSIRLSELIIRGDDSQEEKERWRAVPALKHRYYAIKANG